jgi:hypothetical protein
VCYRMCAKYGAYMLLDVCKLWRTFDSLGGKGVRYMIKESSSVRVNLGKNSVL